MTAAKKKTGALPVAVVPKKRTVKGGHHNHAANSVAWRKGQAELLAAKKARRPVMKRGKSPSTVLVVQNGKPRPTIYDAELAARICLRFATDPDMTLSMLNAEPDMPTVYTFYDWLHTHSDLDKTYARARDIQFDLQAEQLRHTARTPLVGEITVDRSGGKDGNTSEVRRADNVDRARLIIETDKWLLAKQRPKKYGVQPIDVDDNTGLQDLLAQFRQRSAEIEAQ
jgi:hypothetical protein